MISTAFAFDSLPSGAPPAALAVFNLMKLLRHDMLDVQLPDGSWARFGTGDSAALRASIRLRNWNVCAAALSSGDIGFAETFIADDWTTPDLTALLRVFIANRDEVEPLIYGSWWGSLLYRARHFFHRNTRAGSRKNVHAHYDLGNDFYRLWLDPSMNYSGGWFEGDHNRSMHEAQIAKMRRALRQAGARQGSRVLEIGCGWGALAECAAREFGAMVTGVTLSHEQLHYAAQRLSRAGLPGEFRFQDYRDVHDGPYEAIVSIEMFEAVGQSYWADYFAILRKQLAPGGRACVQSIVIRDDLFDRYVRSTDFIQQYIFPGGLLPSLMRFNAAAAEAGLRVMDEFSFGTDYAETLSRWRTAFLANEAPIRQLGFDTRFMRIWEFYLAYCEAAFKAGSIDVVQFTLTHDD